MDCVLSDIQNAKLGTGRSSQRIEGNRGGPLWRRKPELGCSGNEDDIHARIPLYTLRAPDRTSVYFRT
jgi:hypothetical protein